MQHIKRKKLTIPVEDYNEFRKYVEIQGNKKSAPIPLLGKEYIIRAMFFIKCTHEEFGKVLEEENKSSSSPTTFTDDDHQILMTRNMDFYRWYYTIKQNDIKKYEEFENKTSTFTRRQFIILRADTCDQVDSVVDYDEKQEYSVSGSQAYRYLLKLLRRKYSDQEIDHIMKLLSVEKLTDETKEKHFTLVETDVKSNTIYCLDHCYYFDINNAHLFQLSRAFPKCKQAFIALRSQISNFKKKGQLDKAKRYKNLINFAVGQLCNEGYRGFRNWIVQQTREMLEQSIRETNGQLIYANTDGYYVQNPENVYEQSNSLGDFKTELTDGKIYFISVVNREINASPYFLYQFTNDKGEVEKRGNAMLSYREQCDLSKGEYITFEKVLNEASQTFDYKNVKKFTTNIIYKEN